MIKKETEGDWNWNKVTMQQKAYCEQYFFQKEHQSLRKGKITQAAIHFLSFLSAPLFSLLSSFIIIVFFHDVLQRYGYFVIITGFYYLYSMVSWECARINTTSKVLSLQSKHSSILHESFISWQSLSQEINPSVNRIRSANNFTVVFMLKIFKFLSNLEGEE